MKASINTISQQISKISQLMEEEKEFNRRNFYDVIFSNPHSNNSE